MGRPKLLLDLRGKPVIRHTVERLVAAHMDEILVVVAPEHAALERALDKLGVRLVVNPAPEAGQGSSVSAGIQALSARTTAALIVLGDQPGIGVDVIRKLRAALETQGKSIAAPRYADGLGNPVIFSAEVFPELAALPGDSAMPSDLDTPEDYERLSAPDNSR